jgi:hypothetical protein
MRDVLAILILSLSDSYLTNWSLMLMLVGCDLVFVLNVVLHMLHSLYSYICIVACHLGTLDDDYVILKEVMLERTR